MPNRWTRSGEWVWEKNRKLRVRGIATKLCGSLGLLGSVGPVLKPFTSFVAVSLAVAERKTMVNLMTCGFSRFQT